jgi:hypothetical protein
MFPPYVQVLVLKHFSKAWIATFCVHRRQVIFVVSETNAAAVGRSEQLRRANVVFCPTVCKHEIGGYIGT